MKVHVDMNLCQSHGECVFVAPDIFHLGDDDVLVWKEEVDDFAARAGRRRRSDACPMMAISRRRLMRDDGRADRRRRSLARGAARCAGDARRRLRRELVVVDRRRAAPALHAAAAVEGAARRRAGGRRRARSTATASERRRGGSASTAAGLDLDRARGPARRRRGGRLRRACCSPPARGRGAWPDAREVELDGVHVLRDIDRRARAAARARGAASSVAIIGAGFIGCEVAATARKLGLDVTLIERRAAADAVARPGLLGARCRRAAPRPRRRPAARRRRRRRSRAPAGSRRCGSPTARGCRPTSCSWRSARSRTPTGCGIPGWSCSPASSAIATLAALGAEDVFCAGDIAAWPHPLADGETRCGSSTGPSPPSRARRRGAQPACCPATSAGPFVATPYFWSDQYDVKIQSVGLPRAGDADPGDRAAPRRRPARRSPASATAGSSRPSGFNAARRMPFYRRGLAARPPIGDVIDGVARDERALGPAEPPVFSESTTAA